MNWKNDLVNVAAETVNNPKLTVWIASMTTSIGFASFLDIVNGILSTSAMIIGIIATLLLGRLHWIKYKNEIITHKLLIKELNDTNSVSDCKG